MGYATFRFKEEEDMGKKQPQFGNGMKVYLAGPMRGIPEFNFPAFMKAAKNLRDLGFVVFNPAESPDEVNKDHPGYNKGDLGKAVQAGFSLRDALARDTAYICKEADGIVMLPGWENSKGATAERALAIALGLIVFDAKVMGVA